MVIGICSSTSGRTVVVAGAAVAGSGANAITPSTRAAAVPIKLVDVMF